MYIPNEGNIQPELSFEYHEKILFLLLYLEFV